MQSNRSIQMTRRHISNRRETGTIFLKNRHNTAGLSAVTDLKIYTHSLMHCQSQNVMISQDICYLGLQ